MTQRILAFDSGIGGFGIVRALRGRLPGTPVDYLADTAIYPYGEQEDAALIARVVTLMGEAIASLAPDLVVIACNTASTLALGALRERYDIPFVGCVPPIKWAAELSRTRTVGLLATRATVRRPYLRALQQRYAPDCTLLAHGARGLADLAERAFRGHAAPPDIVQRELAALFEQPGGDRIDVVGIGCTHYTFLMDAFRAASPPGMIWLDPADAVARQAATVLQTLPPQPEALHRRDRAFFTTMPAEPARMTTAMAALGYSAPTLFAPATTTF
ncbi:glutamate racemase [Gluconacetobacter liquefaciens]|uniref:Glutamate racemase n=1 Tax=Gluconacetobacter liquefaciens TaxID=89584 RepID=A0A370G6S7_GLULI|nr:aspartate/glutamate racemase family protein [Gluconacetobacter liquefaciens]MBB2186367.1 glutamate racemase [Gluconacetobacter liquefaciens]RDI38910.1 glutamate racemase [Gluconacetobacter liquefaciens]GBQ98295.1 glutamate racemase [Gluconacetobacter liquefaciens NRIC 0522]GEB36550.1 glutamate racemase [Gluconacetobacter liquefaciens]